MGARERNARRMERLVERWEGSGEPAASFARRNGVSVWRLLAWRRRRSRAVTAEGPSLVPVRLLEESGGRESERFELFLSDGRRLLIPSGSSPESLRRILRALSSC